MTNRGIHFRCPENMYKAAPINEIYQPSINIVDSEATIKIELFENFHHAAGGVHGSVYFKMLDGAAFFAANSIENSVFLLPVSFSSMKSVESIIQNLEEMAA